MRALKTMAMTLLGAGFALGLGACTVYVVPAEDRDAPAETMVEADEEGSEGRAETEDADQPPEREVRRRDDSTARDTSTAEAEREAQAREAAEGEARAEAEREAREAAERNAREAAEREARRAAAEEAEAAEEGEERAARNARTRARAGSRELHVPPGHHPPEGECRIWYEDRPPGRQPAAAPCEELLDDDLEPDVFILYGGESWDGRHDWEAVELEHPGAVPRPVLAFSRVVGGDERAQEESEPAAPSDDVEQQDAAEASTTTEDRPGRGRSGSSRGPR